MLRNGEVDTRNGVNAKLVDVAGAYSVAEQQTGELWVRTPALFSGYLGDDEASGCVLVRQEEVLWYRTGDIARVMTAADGSIVYGSDGVNPKYEIVDRLCDGVKISTGEFVSPAQVGGHLSARS